MYRLLSIFLCVALLFGAPLARALTVSADTPCAMEAGADGGGDMPCDCCEHMPRLSACALSCGVALSYVAVTADPLFVVSPFSSSPVPLGPQQAFASLAGPPLLQPPR
jgi:hypothetical protein